MPQPELKNRIHQFLLDKETEFKTSFLNSVHIVQDSPETICIVFPHLYFREWFHARIRHDFEHVVFTHSSAIKHIKYDVRLNHKGSEPFALYQGNGNYHFDNFFHNDKNYFAYISAQKFSLHTQSFLNPFLICGQNGTGKTHLISSIANALFEHHIHEKIFFCTTNELNACYHSKIKSSFEFIKNILEFDCLILDDLQDIQHFKTLQEDIVSIIDRYQEQGKPMVFACCDRLAAQDALNSKLKSRLEGGFMTHLELPDLDIRVRFIRQRCSELSVALTESQILDIAQCCSDFKTLSKVMISILARKDLSGREHVRTRDVRAVIETLSPQPPMCDARTILNTVAGHFKLDLDTLTSPCRTREVVLARQVAMTLCREMLGHSYAQIGLLFGGKNHSSVLHSIKKIKTLREDDHEMKNVFKALKTKISSRE